LLTKYEVLDLLSMISAGKNQKTLPNARITFNTAYNHRISQKKQAIVTAILRLLTKCDVFYLMLMISAEKNQKTLLITLINIDSAYKYKLPKTS